MTYYTVKPSERLKELVRFFWIFEGSASTAQPFVHRTLANSSPELIFHFAGTFHDLLSDGGSERSFQSGVHAQTSRYRRFRTEDSFGILGAYLYPYAIPILFGLPADELTDRLLDLSTLVTSDTRDLNEKVFSAANNSERISIVSTWLEHRYTTAGDPRVVYAVQAILQRSGMVDVGALARKCNVSVRQLQRVFRDSVGLSPKKFSRIVRFNSVVRQQVGPDVSMASLGYEFGYYDQSHFIRDFTEFTGLTPGTFFSRTTDDCSAP